MTKYFVLALGLLAACDGGKLDSGDTAYDTDTNTGGTTPPVITGWDASCIDDETYEGTVSVSGDSSGVSLLNIWETGSPNGNGWNEEHDLFNNTVTLTQVTEIADVQSGSTSLFGCGAGEQFDLDETSLTYSVRVYDVDGAFADCIVFGHMPQEIIDGTYDEKVNPPSNEGELRDCHTL